MSEEESLKKENKWLKKLIDARKDPEFIKELDEFIKYHTGEKEWNKKRMLSIPLRECMV